MKKYSLCFCLAALLGLACSREDGQKPEVYISIPGAVEYGVMEGYPDGKKTEPQLWLIMNTDTMDPPWFNLSTDLEVDGNNTFIDLLGIGQDINASSMTIARGAYGEEFFKLPNGENTLRFYGETDSAIHRVEISDSLIFLPYQLSSTVNSDYSLRYVHRYKTDVFGVIFKGYNDKKWVVETFADSLVNSYGYKRYYYDNSAALPVNFSEAKYFLSYDGTENRDFGIARQFLIGFTHGLIKPNTNSISELTIEIIDWKNERASSKDYYLGQ